VITGPFDFIGVGFWLPASSFQLSASSFPLQLSGSGFTLAERTETPRCGDVS
jgi:hypothetical protein